MPKHASNKTNTAAPAAAPIMTPLCVETQWPAVSASLALLDDPWLALEEAVGEVEVVAEGTGTPRLAAQSCKV